MTNGLDDQAQNKDKVQLRKTIGNFNGRHLEKDWGKLNFGNFEKKSFSSRPYILRLKSGQVQDIGKCLIIYGIVSQPVTELFYVYGSRFCG